MEQQQAAESSGWLGQLTEVVQVVQKYPLGILVVLLVVAIWWLVRKVEALSKERMHMASALYHAQDSGHELDDETTEVISHVRGRRKERR